MTEKQKQTIAKDLRRLRVAALADAYEEQVRNAPLYDQSSFDERFQELVATAVETADEKRTKRLIRSAHPEHPSATLEGIIDAPGRTYNKRLLASLRDAAYVPQAHNVIITGAAGAGKSYFASALAVDACRCGYRTKYTKLKDLMLELGGAEHNGEYTAALKPWTSLPLIVLDEFLLIDLTAKETQFLYDIIAGRHCHKSTIFCTHWKPDGWHVRLGNGPLAESMLDRILPRSHQLIIEGAFSMREKFETVSDLALDESHDILV